MDRLVRQVGRCPPFDYLFSVYHMAVGGGVNNMHAHLEVLLVNGLYREGVFHVSAGGWVDGHN